jgi:hypothetical protein
MLRHLISRNRLNAVALGYLLTEAKENLEAGEPPGSAKMLDLAARITRIARDMAVLTVIARAGLKPDEYGIYLREAEISSEEEAAHLQTDFSS